MSSNYLKQLANKLRVKVWVDREEAAEALSCCDRAFRRTPLYKGEGKLEVFHMYSVKNQIKKAFTLPEWLNWAADYGLKKGKDKKYERFKMQLVKERLYRVQGPPNLWLSIFLLGAYVKGFKIVEHSKVLESAEKEHYRELTDDLGFLLNRSPLAKSATTGRWIIRYELGDEPF